MQSMVLNSITYIMKAADPDKGITFFDFVAVQWRVRGGSKDAIARPIGGVLLNFL